MEKLRDCFCGRAPKLTTKNVNCGDHSIDAPMVICDFCKSQTVGANYPGEERKAIEEWNKRTKIQSERPEIGCLVDEDTGLVTIFVDNVRVVEWVSDDGEPDLLVRSFTDVFYAGMDYTDRHVNQKPFDGFFDEMQNMSLRNDELDVEQRIIGIEMLVEEFGINNDREISLNDYFELTPGQVYDYCDEMFGGDSQHVRAKAKPIKLAPKIRKT